MIINNDCLEEIKKLPDNSVDLVVMDPPYYAKTKHGGGRFGTNHRSYYDDTVDLKTSDDELGYDREILNECKRVLKKMNMYIWCNKLQLKWYLTNLDYSFTILTWHKTNPTPLCNNKYLSDTEYCIHFREEGVPIYGDYHSKKTYWITGVNKVDKKEYNHPTIKPLEIIKDLVYNSSKEGEVVLDPFMGSGTTGVACRDLNREFIGFEINEEYFNTAKNRIETKTVSTVDLWS